MLAWAVMSARLAHLAGMVLPWLLSLGVASGHELVGASLPRLALEDLDGKAHVVERGPGHKPLVLVWEDDESSRHKQAAHAVVGRYSDNPDNRAVFELVAVADMGRWNWWPAKKHARTAIKKTVADAGTGVYIDWLSTLRKAYGLKRAQSAFFVVDGEGLLRFFAQGQLDPLQTRALDDAIVALGAKPMAGR